MAHFIFLLDTTDPRHPSEFLGLDLGLFRMGVGKAAGRIAQTFTSVPVDDQNGREGRT